MKPRWTEALWAGGLAAVVTLFFADVLFAGLNLFVRDLLVVYYPERSVLASILRDGVLPYWNPLYAGGQPLAANPGYQAFYPPQWLLQFGDFRTAFHLEVILHYPLAAAGMYLLARSLGARRLAALFAGFCYALGGTMIGLSALLPFEFAMAWLPWLALCFRRYVTARGPRDGAFAALILGLILLNADVSMILQSGALIGAYAVRAAWRRRREARSAALRPLLQAAAVIAVASLIGAIQIIPALDLQRDSGRAHAIDYSTVMRWPTPPARLLETVWPTLFGSFTAEAPFAWGYARIFDTEGLPWLLHIYPGILVTLLVAAGLLGRVRGWMFAASVAAISVLFALGRKGLIFPALYAAGLRSIRYPEKFLLTAIFVLTAFAAVAADAALREPKVRRIAATFGAILTTVTLVAVGITFLPNFAEIFRGFWGVDADAANDLSRRFRDGMLISLGTLVVATLLLGVERLSPRLRVGLLAVLAVVDLGARQQGWMMRTTADFYTPPAAARELAAVEPPVRIYSHAEWQRLYEPQPPTPFGLRAWTIRNGLLPYTHMTWGLAGVLERDITTTQLLPTIDFSKLVETARTQKRYDRMPLLMQMGGVSHVGVLQPVAPEVLSDPRRFDYVAPAAFVPTNNAGRFYFAEAVTTGESVDLVAPRLFSSTLPLPEKTAFAALPSFPPASGRVVSAEQTPNAIRLDVVADGRALLVLSVTRHKYWQATIDGSPATLVPANVAFQSLVIERGAHRVELRYRNPLIARSALATLAGLLIVAAGLFARQRVWRTTS